MQPSHYSNKIIIAYAIDQRRYDFFVRFIKPLAKFGYKFLIITHRRSLKNNTNIMFIKRSFNNEYLLPEDVIFSLINRSKDKGSIVSLKKAQEFQCSLYDVLYRINEISEISQIWFWNGTEYYDRVLARFCIDNGLDMRFIETSNVAGKLFVDPRGVNSDSYLFDKFLNFNCDKIVGGTRFSEGSKNLFRGFKQGKVLPQLSEVKSLNLLFFLDYFHQFSASSIYYSRQAIFSKLFQKIVFKVFNRVIPNNKIENSSYLLVPLQVVSDSQLVLNSRYSNSDVIEYALKIAKKNEVVCVKFHPGEPNGLYEFTLRLRYIFRRRLKFIEGDILDMIVHSVGVVTANSTVGLEALVLDKNVIFLGETYYSYFDGRILDKFLFDFLLPAPVAEGASMLDFVDRVLRRSETDVDLWFGRL